MPTAGDSGAGEGVPADMGDMADAPVPVRGVPVPAPVPVQEAGAPDVPGRISFI